jgi:hypothetical protein
MSCLVIEISCRSVSWGSNRYPPVESVRDPRMYLSGFFFVPFLSSSPSPHIVTSCLPTRYRLTPTLGHSTPTDLSSTLTPNNFLQSFVAISTPYHTQSLLILHLHQAQGSFRGLARLWILLSFGMWRCVFWYKITFVSEVFCAFIFRIFWPKDGGSGFIQGNIVLCHRSHRGNLTFRLEGIILPVVVYG